MTASTFYFTIKHFSAFWLRSSVASVLTSLKLQKYEDLQPITSYHFISNRHGPEQCVNTLGPKENVSCDFIISNRLYGQSFICCYPNLKEAKRLYGHIQSQN